MLFLKEEFLSKCECDQIINFYHENINDSFLYRNTYPLRVIDSDNDLIKSTHNKVVSICEILSDVPLILDNCEIVKWPEGSFQDAHYDGDDVFAVIIYLNDDFDGGETCFQLKSNVKIHPEMGKCLIFSNSKYFHWVEQVKKNTRYTLAYWFVKS